MRSWAASLLLLASATGCVGTWRRDQAAARLLREHYSTVGAPARAEALRAIWEDLDWTQQYACLSLNRPCRATSASGTFCFRWGEEAPCFKVHETRDGLQLERTNDSHGQATERWLYEALDPAFAATSELAAQVADAEVSAEETPPTDSNSFWAAARAVAQLPLGTLGLQAQGGYRRWLDHYAVLSAGAGYERTLTRQRGFFEPRDALLFSARVELSPFDALAKTRAYLPVVSLYFGLTGVLGLTPEASWGTRVYLGFSAIVPFSLELGYSVSAFPAGELGQFYLAAGFGL